MNLFPGKNQNQKHLLGAQPSLSLKFNFLVKNVYEIKSHQFLERESEYGQVKIGEREQYAQTLT